MLIDDYPVGLLLTAISYQYLIGETDNPPPNREQTDQPTLRKALLSCQDAALRMEWIEFQRSSRLTVVVANYRQLTAQPLRGNLRLPHLWPAAA
jgi:hypothetical protein